MSLLPQAWSKLGERSEHGKEAEMDEEVTDIAAKQYRASVATNTHYFEEWETALNNDDTKAIAKLIEKGFDINIPLYGELPLSEAARTSAVITKFLLETGADVHRKTRSSKTSLQIAVRYHKYPLEVTRVLLDAGADPNVDPYELDNPLCDAIHRRDVDLVQLLLDRGADPNLKLAGGVFTSPLHFATLYVRDLKIIRVLLDHGANISLESGELSPAVVEAISRRREEQVLLFLKYGAEPPKVLKHWYKSHKELPSSLRRWDTANKVSRYHSFEEFVQDVQHKNDDPIQMKWEWEVPAVIEMVRSSGVSADNIPFWLLYENVVFITDYDATHVTATNCRDILYQHLGTLGLAFVLDFLIAVAAMKLDASHDGIVPMSPMIIRFCRLTQVAVYPSMGLWGTNVFESITVSPKDVTIKFHPWLHHYGQYDHNDYERYSRTMDWLCRTIRMPGPDGSVTLSKAFYSRDRCEVATDFGKGAGPPKRRIRFEILPSMHLANSPLPVNKDDCWRRLLNSCVVSLCENLFERASERRGMGKGLELSFDLMVTLAAVEFQLTIDGGVVFVGYQTVLFPTAMAENYA
ncbi:uncharacterized protein Z520_01720 [Fonsecaea multimorphosa CBS 102226]|uniref:Uncharacterized protein n=1 Tax=Fonsecaea multimorphosa CBS 102226 TaxID=1442371 RepID=A0A0D2KB55_9EURO|nr:uncharacterized protein Z520_01720 [Fonsecaea multimorphosa CBS 102226]KIY03253.1 hypothetical protein Z520_01720 [Fonsecaea multimorphosa CBS 102226]OAL30172.1 hypothetical protein AYO22_01688 [Fonsecaea multimorphosa]